MKKNQNLVIDDDSTLSENEIEIYTPPQLKRQSSVEKKKRDVKPVVIMPVSKNKWVDHVKKVSQDKGITYKQAMSIAKETYNK